MLCEWVQIPDECYLHSQRVHKHQRHQLMKILHHGGNFHFQQVLMLRWLQHWFRHRQHRIRTIIVRTNLIYVSHNWCYICARVFFCSMGVYIYRMIVLFVAVQRHLLFFVNISVCATYRTKERKENRKKSFRILNPFPRKGYIYIWWMNKVSQSSFAFFFAYWFIRTLNDD